MSVRRAQIEISSREFAEWVAYEEESPGYPERGDLNAAFVCKTLVDVMSSKKGTRYSVQDFMPKFDKKRQRTFPTMKELKIKLQTSLRTAKIAIERDKKDG